MQVTARGIDDAREKVEALAARLRDLSPILTVAAQDTRALIDDSFANEQSPDGAAWAPLAPATLRISPRRAGGKTLSDTARLRQSITTQVSPDGFRFGTNVAYAGPHQLGAIIKVFGRGTSRALRARPFMPVTGTPGRYGLMTTGAAGEHWTRVRADVAHWVRTGEVR